MISTTLQTKSISLVKAIYFDQFLELVNALSEIYSPKLYAVSTKKALKKVLSKFVTLLGRLENGSAQGPASVYSAVVA